MKLAHFRTEGRAALKGNWGKAILISLIVSFLPAIGDLVSFAYDIVNNFEAELNITLEIVILLYSVMCLPLILGEMYYFINISRNKSGSVSDAFRFYADLKVFFKAIFSLVYVFLLIFLWSLLLIIPGIIKGLSYSMSLYLIIDYPDLKIKDAISLSKKMMNGYKWKYFLLNLSFTGWILLGIITLFIGFIWIVPYISATNAAFYNYVKNQYKAEE
jgi:uncharacterized membrane protein